MTMQEIESSTKDMLLASDISDVLGCTPYTINVQAQTDPGKLGFPVIVTETRVRIPREAFLFFMKYGRPTLAAEEIYRPKRSCG